MSRLTLVLLGVLLLLTPAPARADDLTGADRLVCAAMVVVACWETGECEERLPSELNVPQFIEIDLKQKRLSTTEASGEDRSTPVTTLLRQDGAIVLQGHEAGRAFSFVISEATGKASVAVARDGLGVSVFGACTPALSSR
ncbi:MAG TPA: hypothetical protein VD788_09175 [Candidatus Polarisedimenticolaceae bacterium]|nr:hypothetical protein [Candidatus Polarisedimenticolaceae bacterium]